MSQHETNHEGRQMNRRAFLKGAASLASVSALTPLVARAADIFASSDTDAGTSSKVEDATHVVTDIAGREVTLPAVIKRAAVMVHPSFETVIMLGAWDQVILTGNKMAQSGWGKVICPEYSKIQAVENATDPNLEEFAEKGVDVVFFWDSYPEIAKKFADLDIPMVVTQVADSGVENWEQFVTFKKHEVTSVAETFGGKAVERAQKWCDWVDATAKKITDKTSQLSTDQIPSVYYVRGPEATTAHGGVSNTRWLVDMAGGDLVTKDVNQTMFDTTMEQIIEWNPAYIFMGRVDNKELVTEDPNFAGVQAVQDGNIFVNMKGMGPTDYCTDCFLMMEQIAQDLHPDLFTDLDMVREVKDYYRDFYDYTLSDDDAERILTFRGPASEDK